MLLLKAMNSVLEVMVLQVSPEAVSISGHPTIAVCRGQQPDAGSEMKWYGVAAGTFNTISRIRHVVPDQSIAIYVSQEPIELLLPM